MMNDLPYEPPPTSVPMPPAPPRTLTYAQDAEAYRKYTWDHQSSPDEALVAAACGIISAILALAAVIADKDPRQPPPTRFGEPSFGY
jgi:hypothetical protein